MSGRRIAVSSLVIASLCGVLIVVFDIHDDARRAHLLATGRPNATSNLLFALRFTVRISAVFFLAAFLARPLNDLLRARWTRWLLKNRRYLGLSCAAFLLQHLWLLPALQLHGPLFQRWWGSGNLIPATISLLLATALTLTSFNAAQRSFRYWKPLHWIGVHAMWFWYTKSFYVEWTSKFGRAYHLVGLIAFLAALAIRVLPRLPSLRRTRRRDRTLDAVCDG